jgi:glycosyltransferase involved in cell wall biosynthesis
MSTAAKPDAPDRALRMATVAFYLPSESKIGAGWMAHRFANTMAGRGHHVVMFSPSAKPDDAVYRHEHVPLTGKNRIVQWARRMRDIDFSGFDVLHAQGDDHLVRRDAVPVHVRTLHGSCFDEARFARGARDRVRMLMLGMTEAVTAARVPHVVGVSHNSIRMYPWLRRVIPNGVDHARFRPGGTRERHPTILFVGTFRGRKRGALLHEVFTEYVRPRLPTARLWMICDDAPSASGIDVLGRVSDDELADRYQRAWVCCLPSAYEGFGVPYVEAMMSGVAVVASPNLGAREILDHGRLGVLSSDEALGRNLVRLLLDTDRRERLATDALAGTVRYHWDNVAAEYEALYREARQQR